MSSVLAAGTFLEDREPLLRPARFVTSLHPPRNNGAFAETRSSRRLYCFCVFEEDGLAIDRVDGGMP